MAYPRAAPPAIVAAGPNVLGLSGLDEDAGRGGFAGIGASSTKAPGIDELDGLGGLDEGTLVLGP
jgi:hypothetical protein